MARPRQGTAMCVSDIKKEVRAIRPSLRIVAPGTFYTTILFSVLNIGLVATYPLTFHQIKELQTIIGLPIWMWLVVFGVYGFLLAMFLLLNEWKHLKQLYGVGIVIKTAWLFQLTSIWITEHDPVILLLDILWGALTWLTISTFVYFTLPRDGR